MTIKRFFTYLLAMVFFIYVLTKAINLLNAPNDTEVVLGVGVVAGLLFLAAEFVKFVRHSLKKEKA